MNIFLLRKRARKCGMLLRAVPGGGWCLLDAGTGAVVAGPLDLEHIEKSVHENEAAVSAANTGGGKVEQHNNNGRSTSSIRNNKEDVKNEKRETRATVYLHSEPLEPRKLYRPGQGRDPGQADCVPYAGAESL